MTTTSPDNPTRRPRLLAPWLVLALTLLLTAVVASYVVAEAARLAPAVTPGAGLALTILLTGLAFGVALFFITRSQVRARRKEREATAALRASESRFRTVVEQSPVSTQIFSPDGRTIRVNRAWEELWGVTLERLGGYNILEDPQLEEKGIA
nr:PAS domain S-box protein [Acidobacteriota bacterium]